MPLYVVKDPKTGEEVELVAPEGMSLQQATDKAFPPSLGERAMRTARGAGEVLESGLTKAAYGLATFPWQAGVGLATTAAGAADKALGTNLQEPLERGVTAIEKPFRESPGFQADYAKGEKQFDNPVQRYAKEAVAGSAGGLVGPGTAAKVGSVLGGLGGLSGQAAAEANMPPIYQLAATVFPMLSYSGFKALRDPPAVQQVKSALAATSEADLLKAKQMIATAKERGVDLSPAQALGPNHPLVPILEQVGRSAGGSDKVKIFLGAQDAPTNVLTDQVTNAFGSTDAQTAANVTAQRAAGIRASQEKAPGRIAGPYYRAAEAEPLSPGIVDQLRDDLTALKANLAPAGADVKAIDAAIRLLQKGTKEIGTVTLSLGDDGVMSLTKGTKTVPIPIDTFGQLKNVRDLTKPPEVGAVPMAGEFPTTFNTQRNINTLVRDASKTSPNLSAADALFAKRTRDLEKVRMGPLTQLAGPQLRNDDAASNFSRISQFLDPARNSPKRIDKTLSQLTEPREKVVQQLTAGYLHNATERARKGEGYAPAQIETLLRGGEGSGKRAVLESLIRRSIGEQNKSNPLDMLDPDTHVTNLMSNLDVMEATGRGRGALSGVENIPRVAAQLDTPVQLARGSSANIVSQTPSLIRFSEQRANKQLAEALTDPSLAKLLEMRDYDRIALIAEMLRRATQTSAVTGD